MIQHAKTCLPGYTNAKAHAKILAHSLTSSHWIFFANLCNWIGYSFRGVLLLSCTRKVPFLSQTIHSLWSNKSEFINWGTIIYYHSPCTILVCIIMILQLLRNALVSKSKTKVGPYPWFNNIFWSWGSPKQCELGQFINLQNVMPNIRDGRYWFGMDGQNGPRSFESSCNLLTRTKTYDEFGVISKNGKKL